MTAAAVMLPAGSQPLANEKHERFCREYLQDRNGQAAYERAGYSAKGDVAKSAASRLLTNVNVRERVAYLEAEHIAAIEERTGLNAEQVLRELAVLGQSDIRHYVFTDDAQGIALAADAPDAAMRAVSSVRRKRRLIQHEDGPDEIVEEVEYKLWNKPAALRMAGEHLKLFTQKHEIAGGPVGPPLSAEDVAREVVEMLNRTRAVRANEKLLQAAGMKDADYEVVS